MTTGVAEKEGGVTLEHLRKRMAEFAKERDWDQFHSPRNLLLALVTLKSLSTFIWLHEPVHLSLIHCFCLVLYCLGVLFFFSIRCQTDVWSVIWKIIKIIKIKTFINFNIKSKEHFLCRFRRENKISRITGITMDQHLDLVSIFLSRLNNYFFHA